MYKLNVSCITVIITVVNEELSVNSNLMQKKQKRDTSFYIPYKMCNNWQISLSNFVQIVYSQTK